MAIGRQPLWRAEKMLLFEYLVYLLEQWRLNSHPNLTGVLTKLKLQKILFLVASVNATVEYHPLLDVFNKFYALPYGPVEIDIYEAMKSSEFKNIKFDGNNCEQNLNESQFINLNESLKSAMNASLQTIKDMGVDYIIMPPFDLVSITHKWTSWQVAMHVAEMLGNRKEYMSTEDIYNSSVKAFK